LDEDLLELGKSVGWINSEVDNIDLWRCHSEELGFLKYKNIFEKLSFELDGYIGHLPMLGEWFYYNYKWDDDVEEYIDLKESNRILYIFSKLPELGIEQD
jgi:hypothetical protein